MTAVKNLPVSSTKGLSEAEAPVVTLLGTDLPEAYLDDAEPSPLMEKANQLWRRFKRLMLLAIIVGAATFYPMSILSGHHIDDREIFPSDTVGWESTEIGTMLTLLGRELTGAGWTGDRPDWHPQARLTALPAWQSGLAGALSDYSAVLASRAPDSSGRPDADLSAASRLLSLAEGTSDSLPSLSAAAEALQRYDGRLARNLAPEINSVGDLDARLIELTDWANNSLTALRQSANTAQGWPASTSDIEAIYHARARAHVAGELLKAATQISAGQLSALAMSNYDDALFAWRRAALFSPLIIMSQARTDLILSDHPGTMAFYMSEAATATEALRLSLRNQEMRSADLSQ